MGGDGWYLDRQKGSHRQYKHPSKRGLVTVSGKPSHDLHPKTRDSIWLSRSTSRPSCAPWA
ncbi:MAG TPA: type II toxin-antitoxin system HicA family toxin [Streptosporangiaceae bacterium]|nr:type II toxin-antitoxin system HicA family toxin [Streptosporangiaceae bacterium]